MSENNKLLSFYGSIGRRWFLLRSLLALLIPIACLIPVLVASYFLGSEGTQILSRESLSEVSNSLGLIVIVPWMIVNFTALFCFFIIVIGLQIRRGRDIFRQTRPRPIVEFILVFLFWGTRGFFGIGALALLVWPGALAQTARSVTSQS